MIGWGDDWTTVADLAAMMAMGVETAVVAKMVRMAMVKLMMAKMGMAKMTMAKMAMVKLVMAKMDVARMGVMRLAWLTEGCMRRHLTAECCRAAECCLVAMQH